MYAHKSNIITSIFKVDEEGLLDTIRGQVNVRKDDYIATNALGEQLVFSEEYVKAMESITVTGEPKETKEMKADTLSGVNKCEFRSKFIEDYLKSQSEVNNVYKSFSNNNIWNDLK